MAWNGGACGGFNKGHEPWQSLHTDYEKINAEKDLAAEKSVYRFYQKLLAVKKTNPAAIGGRVEEYDHENKAIVAYSREGEGNRLFVLGNFSKRPMKYTLPGWTKYAETLLDNYGGFSAAAGTVTLKPYQAVVLEVKN